MTAIVLSAAVEAKAKETSEGGELARPTILEHCEQRIRHAQWNGTSYFFSWEHPQTRNATATWFQARNVCRRHCMDSVSLDTREEHQFISDKMQEGGQRFIWTSGRKCDFDGCEDPSFQPTIENGWFWTATGVRLAPTTNRLDGEWSHTGKGGEPQPDNREFKETGKNDEACLAVFNNFYGDGVKWHDVACHYEKPFVCEDNAALINYMKGKNPGARL